MGKRQLAYEILHHKDGTFVLLEIEGSGREIAELERRMRVNDRVLRYITVRVDEDRRRAEKLKDRRARKAAKRPERGGGSSGPDRKSTRLNSSHVEISYAVFCLKKKRLGMGEPV